MIKIEHVVLPTYDQMEFVIEGMRNPKNSWDFSDFESVNEANGYDWEIGENDLRLMKVLSEAGTEHRKYLRMMPVYARITAPLYW